jgi:hypothetical protein
MAADGGKQGNERLMGHGEPRAREQVREELLARLTVAANYQQDTRKTDYRENVSR